MGLMTEPSFSFFYNFFSSPLKVLVYLLKACPSDWYYEGFIVSLDEFSILNFLTLLKNKIRSNFLISFSFIESIFWALCTAATTCK